MQHPVAYTILPNGRFSVASLWGLLSNPWALIQYIHTMNGAVFTGAFVMAALGASYLLQGKFTDHTRIFVQVGVLASIFQVFPSGDLHSKYMARHQPVTTAGMEGLSSRKPGADRDPGTAGRGAPDNR